MSQLKILIPERVFEVSEGKVTLKPFKFKQFNEALAIIEPYLKTLSSVGSAQEVMENFLQKQEEGFKVLEDLTELLCMVSSEQKPLFEALYYDEVIALAIEVIDMNMDFFARLSNRFNKEEEAKEAEAKKAKTGEEK